jgi:hypothetical protein
MSYDVQWGAYVYIRQEYWPTSGYDGSWPHLDTMNA